MAHAANIERYLTSKNNDTRRQWAINKTYTPTPEQIDRGLRDTYSDVVTAWLMRRDYKITRTQVDFIMRRPGGNTFINDLLRRREWSILSSDVDLILDINKFAVSLSLLMNRHDYQLTQAQFDRLMEGTDAIAVMAMNRKESFSLMRPEHFGRAEKISDVDWPEKEEFMLSHAALKIAEDLHEPDRKQSRPRL